jgi:hypothetical protein
MKRFFRDNGLSLVLFGVFFVTLFIGQVLTGKSEYNEDRKEHGQEKIGLVSYLQSAHFMEATMENWESEFLQMAGFVILSGVLYQRGSAESKDPDKPADVDEDPALHRHDPNAPWPVRRGGWILWIYAHSLSIAFLLLFGVSFILHAISGCREFSEDQVFHGEQPVSVLQFMITSRFWFQSFQNWQSEFLAIGAMVVLSIWLRQKGSPESKRVAAPHSDTGR